MGANAYLYYFALFTRDTGHKLHQQKIALKMSARC